jgi:hypothetical protein
MSDHRRVPIRPDHPLASVPPEALAAFGYAMAKLIAGVWRREQERLAALQVAS